MQINRAHKIELKPSNTAKAFFTRAFGVRRFTYNYALRVASRYYRIFKKSISFARLKAHWNKRKPDWVYESPKDANQRPFMDLDKAFKRFFKGIGKYPRYKKKGTNDSFYIANDQAKLTATHIHIPKFGLVRLKEIPRFEGKILSFTISKQADRYFVSVSYQLEITKRVRKSTSAGVDLGIKDLASLSTGEVIPNPKHLKKSLARLKRYQRRVSKSKKGSSNRRKKLAKLAKLHWKISNKRNDTIHKLTSDLTSRFGRIVIEDLNVKGMIKNHNLAQAISDCSFSEIRRQLEYKSKDYNVELVIADRFYPSSRLCNCCGYKNKDLTLKDRTWTCPSCAAALDRDINAAINLNNYTIGWDTPEFTLVDSGVQDPRSLATGRSKKITYYLK